METRSPMMSFSKPGKYRFIIYHWKGNFMLNNICSRTIGWKCLYLEILVFKKTLTALKRIQSRNCCLLKSKPCLTNGRTVNQFETSFSWLIVLIRFCCSFISFRNNARTSCKPPANCADHYYHLVNGRGKFFKGFSSNSILQAT